MAKTWAIAVAITVSLILLILYALHFLLASFFGDWRIGPGVHDFSANLTGGYVLHHTSGIDILINGPSGAGIPPTVEQLAYDSNFILAKQQQLQPRFENDDRGDPIPGKFNYWIVDVNHSKQFGPLDESQFVAKRNELKVDPALILRDEFTFDPRKNQELSPPDPTPAAR